MPDEPHPFSKLAEHLVGDLRRIPSEDPARARKRPTRALNEVLEELLQKHQIGRSSPEQAIRDRWVEIVGTANAAYSHAVRIERHRLLILVAHPVVRNELFHHSAEIVARIQQLPGCSGVKSINLRTG